MATSRYKNLDILVNDDLDYKKEFESRFGDRDLIRHYETQEMDYPTFEETKLLTFSNHIWKFGDRYYKLAHQHYGDSRYWWIIAWFNKKPTDQHVKVGDLVKIPLPLNDVLKIYGY